MGEVGSDRASRRRSGNCVARIARPAGHIIVSGESQWRSRRRRGLQLMLPPFEEVAVAVDVDNQRHLRMLSAAKLRALPTEDSDLSGSDRGIVLTPGNGVLLSREAGL